MRHPIETAPKDGKAVILEHDPSGTYDVAQWSAEAGNWVTENGEPSKIAPTHWRVMPGEADPSRDTTHASRRRPASSRIRWLIAASGIALIGAVVLRDQFGFELKVPSVGERSPTTVSLARPQHVKAEQDNALAATDLVQAKQAEVADVQLQDAAASRARALEQERQQTIALAQEAATIRQEPAAGDADVRRALDEERARSAGLKGELAAAQRDSELQAAQLRNAIEELGQLRQAAASNAEALEQERRKADVQAQEAAAAKQELVTSAVKYRQSLDEEYARQALQWSELAAAQRETESKAAQLRKAKEEIGQLRQTAAGDRGQDLQRERGKSAALAEDAAAARQELAASTAKHRQTLDDERTRSAAVATELAAARRENETKTTQLRKAIEDMAEFAQTTERTVADLRQSLQRERDRAEAMAREIESAQRTITMSVSPTKNVSPEAQPRSIGKPAVMIEAVATAQPPATEAQESQEAAKLIALARALLGQGNIGAARIVLERAVEAGSARASFTLAETYDPAILSTWGTYGTRGDATKARELYAKAHAGGIQDAKDRLQRLNR